MFSYGMNTNNDGMNLRCPDATCIGAAVLRGYKFRFSYHADIVPSIGDLVHGVLWHITDQCLYHLDILEGYPRYYDRIMVPVEHAGTVYQSWVYRMQDGQKTSMPSAGYLSMVKEGYLQHTISLAQIQQALKDCEKLTENA